MLNKLGYINLINYICINQLKHTKMYINSKAVQNEIFEMQLNAEPQKKPLNLFAKLSLFIYLCFILITIKTN